MKSVLEVGKDVKTRRARVKELWGKPFNMLEVDVRLQLIQELIPLGLMHVEEILQEEVKRLAGQKYKRNGLLGHDRWGTQWGSVYLADQKAPVLVQRVRDMRSNKEVKLRGYERLKGAPWPG